MHLIIVIKTHEVGAIISKRRKKIQIINGEFKIPLSVSYIMREKIVWL